LEIIKSEIKKGSGGNFKEQWNLKIN
jgi:hypothetical protein